MSSFDYSFDSDVEHEGMNIIDMTIDATSTACLDIVDLMTKGLNHRTRHSKLIASWMTSFDAFIDDLYTSSTSSKDCLPAVRKTARKTTCKASQFEDNDVSVIDDKLANQSLELDYSTFSSFVDESYVDQSGEFDSSIYNSDDYSSEYDCSTDQSYDSEDSYNVSQSIEDMYSAPNSSKTRPKTMISITYAGRCIDQIEMGPFDNPAGSTEGKKREKTLHTESESSPSRSIITSDSELLLRSHVETSSSSGRQSYWSYLDCTDEKNLDSVSKTLFYNKVNFCSSPNVSKRMAKPCLGIPEKTSPTMHLFIYIARKSVYSNLPVSLVSHRRNTLSKYNPFSSIMVLLFTCVLMKHVDVEGDDTNWLEENQDDIDEESSLVTIILSDDTPLELAIDGSHNGQDCLNTYKVYWDYFDADLELSSDDASYDSDLTPKFRHPKRVTWLL